MSNRSLFPIIKSFEKPFRNTLLPYNTDNYSYKKRPNAINGDGAEVIGELFNETFQSLSKWTQFGSVSWTAGAGGLSIVGGAGGVFTNYITYDPLPNAYENFKIEMWFKDTTATGGISIHTAERQTVDVTNRSYIASFLTTGANTGKIVFRSCTEGGSTFSTVATSATAMAWAVNDNVKFTMERIGSTYYLSAYNFNSLTSTSVNYTVTNSTILVSPNPSCKFSILSNAGNQTVTRFKVSSGSFKNAQALFIGDSITNGYKATVRNRRFSDLVFVDSSHTWSINAGASDMTAQYAEQDACIKTYNSKYVFCMIGGNDILNGVPTATWQANLRTINNNIINYGSIPVWLWPTPRTSTDVSPIGKFYDANFQNVIKNTYKALLSGATGLKSKFDSGDGVHPNDLGHATIAEIIKHEFPYINQ